MANKDRFFKYQYLNKQVCTQKQIMKLNSLFKEITHIQQQLIKMFIMKIILIILCFTVIKTQNCPQNCQSCTDPSYCNTCLPFYYLNLSNNQCYLICPINCVICTSSGICNLCKSSYQLDKINNTCNVCNNSIQCNNNNCSPSYYYDQTNFRCAPCGIACSLCINSTTCLTCLDRYYLNETTYHCSKCNYPCINCLNNTSCQFCDYSYVMNFQDGNCIKCPFGCNLCKNQSYCLICNINLVNNNGQCIASSAIVSQTKTGLIIGIVIAGVISLVAILIFGCIYCFMKKRRLQQINNQQFTQRLEDQRISSRNRFINDSFKQQPTTDYKFELETQCSICLELRCDLATECNHFFHKECLKQWFSRNQFCPLCKGEQIQVVRVLLCYKCLRFSQRFCIFNVQFFALIAKEKKNQQTLHKCDIKQETIQNQIINKIDKNEKMISPYKQQQKQDKQGQMALDSQDRLRIPS